TRANHRGTTILAGVSMTHASLRRATLVAVGFFALALPARGGTIAADALPLPNRVATADMVIVGRVTGMEDRDVLAAPFPGAKNKVEFKIAVVTVTEARAATNGNTT